MLTFQISFTMLPDATSATTRGIITKVEFTWIIHDILKWPENESEGMNSPLFHARNDEGIKWGLKIGKYTPVDHQLRDGMSLELYLRECPVSKPTVTARYSVTIKDEIKEGKLLCKIGSTPVRFSVHKAFVRPTCPGRSTMPGEPFIPIFFVSLPIGSREEYMKIPTVSIHIIIEYEKEQIVTTSSTSSLINGVSASKSSWSADFGKLFTSQIGSDICFIIADQEIKAHKAILSARSPVFSAMFNSDMMEKGLERVDISDISPDNFNEFLRFIYTDRVHLTEINAEHLLAAADKYLIPSLKCQCEEYLIKYLTTENCIELLRLADLHSALNLKGITQDFFRSNQIEVRKTDSWKALRESDADIALDVIEDILNL